MWAKGYVSPVVTGPFLYVIIDILCFILSGMRVSLLVEMEVFELLYNLLQHKFAYNLSAGSLPSLSNCNIEVRNCFVVKTARVCLH